MKKALICLCILALAGCDQLVPVKQSNQQQQGRQQPQQQSAMGDAVDTVVIQKGKMHAGRRAADKVREVSAQRAQDYNEVMGE